MPAHGGGHGHGMRFLRATDGARCEGHEPSGGMNRKAHILQFPRENTQPDNELEDLLNSMDDPRAAAPEFLFTTPDRTPDREEPEFFQEDDEEQLIFLDDDYLLIDGGDGLIDVMVGDGETGLAALLANGAAGNAATFAKNPRIPLVRDVEVLLSGDIGITRRCDLPRLGIQARDGVLWLDGRWALLAPKSGTGPYSTEIWVWRQRGVRLETTLPVRHLSEGEKGHPVTPFNPDGASNEPHI